MDAHAELHSQLLTTTHTTTNTTHTYTQPHPLSPSIAPTDVTESVNAAYAASVANVRPASAGPHLTVRIADTTATFTMTL